MIYLNTDRKVKSLVRFNLFCSLFMLTKSANLCDIIISIHRKEARRIFVNCLFLRLILFCYRCFGLKIHFVIRFIETIGNVTRIHWFSKNWLANVASFCTHRLSRATQRSVKIHLNWFVSSGKKCIIRLNLYINIILSFYHLQAYIALQSFNVERPKDLPLYASSKGHRKHSLDVLEKYSKPYGLPAPEQQQNRFPVLKIEEDFEDISMTNGTCKSVSTQTSPTNEMNSIRINKNVGSSNSLWTSDESILRGAEEDIKSSSSSSSCEETGGGMSSGKSGKEFQTK